ncbi:MAG: SDR family oxidoreductase [Acidobacteria bacterium]|nr:SDR family oxidoreductase [Acidobacteriota bacterium]
MSGRSRGVVASRILEGKLAIITGAGRGIGKAIAMAFAREGAKLALGARTEVEVHEVADRCVRNYGAKVVVRSMDVADRRSVLDLQRDSRALAPVVDILVNCAGVQGPIGRIDEIDPNEWVQAVAINLCGTFFACHAVLPEMMRRRKGKIINFSGGGATLPRPRFSAYGSSKAAVVKLTETLAEEAKEFNIQINAMAPGAVNSRMLDQVLAAGDRAGNEIAALARKQKQEGGVSPTLAADLAVFLASDKSGGLTGKLISAPHDPWREWVGQLEKINSSPMFTMRRLDPFTLKPLLSELK